MRIGKILISLLLLLCMLPAIEMVHIPNQTEDHFYVWWYLQQSEGAGNKVHIKSIEAIDTTYFPNAQTTYRVEYTIGKNDTLYCSESTQSNPSWKQIIMWLINGKIRFYFWPT